MAAGTLHAGLAGRLSRPERGERQRNRCRLRLRPYCTLFDKTRKWAYRAIRQGWPEYEQWLQACYERASAYNLQFASPLDENEVIGIAKSISKWTSRNLSKMSFEEFVEKTHTPKIQSKRGMKSKGGGRPSLGEPWKDLGISRRKYFYLKRRGHPFLVKFT